MNDYYPTGTIDTTTHQLERAPTWATRQEISSEFLHSDIYSVEFATREIAHRMGIEILACATALYSYTRFDDERLSDSSRFAKTSIEYYPSGPVNTAKQKLSHLRTKLNQVVRHWSYKATGCRFSIGLPSIPKRLLPKLSVREVVTWQDEQVTVERVQESLLAQIALFYKYNIEPQAVFVCPETAGKLAAARTMDERWYQQAAVINGQTTFAGLPVIACSELAQGAMVV